MIQNLTLAPQEYALVVGGLLGLYLAWGRLMSLVTVLSARLLGHDPMDTQDDDRLLMANSVLWSWARGATSRATSWPKWLILASYKRVARAMSRRGYDPRPVSAFRRALYPAGTPASSLGSTLRWSVFGIGVVLLVFYGTGDAPREWLVWYGAIVGGFAVIGTFVAAFTGLIIGTLERGS